MWKHWLNALLGLLVIAIPFIGLDTNVMIWTLAIVGIAIAGISLWGATDQSLERYEQERKFQH